MVIISKVIIGNINIGVFIIDSGDIEVVGGCIEFINLDIGIEFEGRVIVGRVVE